MQFIRTGDIYTVFNPRLLRRLDHGISFFAFPRSLPRLLYYRKVVHNTWRRQFRHRLMTLKPRGGASIDILLSAIVILILVHGNVISD